MNQINIVCKVHQEEKIQLETNYLEYNINQHSVFTYTFWNKNLLRMPRFFSNIGLDMLYVSLFVFGVDRIISRERTVDSWTRKFKLYIPVLEPDKWNRNKELVEEMLKFLSGDVWSLEFRHRDYTDIELKFKEKIEKAETSYTEINRICMFSGGLDSFIGAIDILKEENEISNVLFVSHYGGGKGVKEYQDALRDKLVGNYRVGKDQFLSFYASAKKGVEDTTRTRSFMFFCHAITLATCFNSSIDLTIPENGLISLNIPLTNSRLGSSSTRTTHPYYLTMIQKLLYNFSVKVNIQNPYQFKTKGGMISLCKDLDFLKENIVNTMSCSHPDLGRLQGESQTSHCGNCLPCVIRRASIKKAGLADPTRYRDLDFTSGETARMNLSSYKLGIEKYSSKLPFLQIQKSGPITTNIDEYAQLYSEGMGELKDFIGGI